MRHVLKHAVAALAALLVLLVAYGVLVEPRLVLDERRYTASLPNLGEEWEGTEVAVFSDLQVGMWWANTGMAERVANRVVEADPDAVLIGGDFLYSHDPGAPAQIDTVLDVLDPLLETDIAVYAVLGNHDYEVGAAEELTDALEQAGVTVLRNEAVPLPGPDGTAPDEPLHLVGVGPARPGLADVESALQNVPEDAARIVLMHNPTTFPEMPEGSAPLTVAGHTHCGQVSLPGTPDWSYLGLNKKEAMVADGFAPQAYGAAGNRLFVTCGIGFSLAPIRIGAPPQVVIFELTAER